METKERTRGIRIIAKKKWREQERENTSDEKMEGNEEIEMRIMENK